ncbi:MAG: hypothetical protein KGJ23_03910 [Euryarchaeota archaeon]|nr:hypothetical protein [Euryarchaeota archaeon]MDE1835745.1 hypothetical protein [Euryarchaeota archaeon]MDE1880830.1 hypothetical protein [Euryarchaeota archaeon]MDE2043936.1 hypothetical protein [Thermoplasmata archaeon]
MVPEGGGSAPPKGGSGPLPLSDFERLSAFAPREVHDGYSQKNFRKTLFDYAQRQPPSIARLRWTANGQPSPSFAAILAEKTPPERVSLVIYEPKPDPQAWEFTTPTALVDSDSAGSGRVLTFRYNPHALSPWDPHDPGKEETCVVRFSVRESYIPRSIQQEHATNEGRPPLPPGFELFSIADFSRFVHSSGVVPFRAALHLYTSRTRLRYDLDLLHNHLLADPRAGRFSIEDRVERSSRICHGLDRFVARGALPLLPRRVLELLFESKGLSVQDVSVILGVSQELATAALQSLVGRQFAAFDQRTQMYLPLPQVFLTRAEAEREQRDEEERKKHGPRSETLKASVQELLAEVEAKAGCPLCGGPMPAGSPELLCDDCMAAVEQEMPPEEGDGPGEEAGSSTLPGPPGP